MARIVVTGGAGFIGSHLCGELLASGNEVIAVDNLFTGSKHNISDFLDDINFDFVRHDVTQPLWLECDQVYHLACPASPVHYQYNPIKTIKTSVTGTLNVLGLAKRTKSRFLLASTSEVYGDPLEHPQRETYWGNVNPLGPRSCYDEGKRVAETLSMNYKEQGTVDARIVRIFNTYGPRMLFDDGRVVSNFIVQALKGEDITVYGEGLQTRSFCFVDDLVKGIMSTMNREGFYGPVNLGNPNEMTIIDLANKVIELTGSSSKVVLRPLPTDDPTRRRPDISLAKSELQWEPQVSLDEGLKRTIADFDSRLRAANSSR
jgi:UDP-glucuronate decarboxylase